MGGHSFIHPQAGMNRQFRRASEGQLRQIIHHAHGRREAHVVARTIAPALEVLRAANRFFLDADFGQRTIWLVMPLGLLIVYMIDIGLFRPLAFYLAGRLTSSQFWVVAISFLVPLAILGLDVIVGVIRHYYAELESHWSHFWALIGIVLAVAMPFGVVATQLGALSVSDSRLLVQMHVTLLILLAILSLVSHVVLVFSGRPLFESKAYWLFRWNQFWNQRKLNSATRAFGSHGRTMGHYFGQYLRDLTNWNNQNPHSRIEAGPFDAITREELHEFFGYEAVQLPLAPGQPIVPPIGGTPPNAPPAAPSPPPPDRAEPGAENRSPVDPDPHSSPAPSTPPGGESDLLSADRERYLREQEAAVTP